MKNILIYGLVTFYFLISIRLTANLHFCKDRFVSFSVVGFSTQKSCCKSKEMKNGCCKNIHVSLKKLTNDKPVSTISIPSLCITDLSKPVNYIFGANGSYIPQEICQSINAPPLSAYTTIYIKNCVFII